MDKYVIDLELAKKLKDLGTKQNSEFYIDEYEDIYTIENAKNVFEENEYYKEVREPVILWSCFTSDEILEKLPVNIENLTIWVCKCKNGYTVYYFDEDGYGEEEFCQSDKKLSNALAKMWVFLIENGYVEVNE